MSSFQSPPFPHANLHQGCKSNQCQALHLFQHPVTPPGAFFSRRASWVFLGVKGAAEKKTEPAMKFLVMSCSKTREFQDTFPKITLPKTNSSPLKIGHPKRELVIQPSIFGCYVSFREGICFFLLLQCLEKFLKYHKYYLSNSLAQTVVFKAFMLKMPVIRDGKADDEDDASHI